MARTKQENDNCIAIPGYKFLHTAQPRIFSVTLSPYHFLHIVNHSGGGV